MSVKEQFEKAQGDVTKLKSRPNNETMLDLYSLYKQGTEGDAQGDRPGALDIIKRAKWDAWSKRQGMSADEAMQAYVDLVTKLISEDS
ncbi:acyl-CoA-binding protein [Bdellovibrionota bacterium]